MPTQTERQNIQTLPTLLRAIANSEQGKLNRHDIILNAAADLIESLAKQVQW